MGSLPMDNLEDRVTRLEEALRSLSIRVATIKRDDAIAQMQRASSAVIKPHELAVFDEMVGP